MQTLNEMIADGTTLSVHCKGCHRVRGLNLRSMAARGLGDRDRDSLRFRCQACGCRRHGWVASNEWRDDWGGQVKGSADDDRVK